MLILANELPIKPYLAWGINRAGKLTVTGHVSLKAAKVGMGKIEATLRKVPGDKPVQYGWHKIEPRERQMGIVL